MSCLFTSDDQNTSKMSSDDKIQSVEKTAIPNTRKTKCAEHEGGKRMRSWGRGVEQRKPA